MSDDNLQNLLNALTETGVHVIEEKTHRLLYFNKRCQETGRGNVAIGIKCHEIWPEVCANCPLEGMKDNSSNHIVCYDPLLKTTVDVTANRIIWEGHIQAVVVTATPHRLDLERIQGFQKVDQMYAQSLVTVFDECVIANLTTDYYVNCQRDIMWTDIPKQGDFDIQNHNYAKSVLHPDDLKIFNEFFSREAMLRLFGEGRKKISKQLRRLSNDGTYHMGEFTAVRIEQFGEEECWSVLVFRDIQEEYLLKQQKNVEISQLATAARIAYQMLIAVNLTQNTYHMLEYERFPVKKPDDEGCFQDFIEFELSTVHPDYREEFMQKFSRCSLIAAFSKGERIVTMEVPHFGEDGIYHWNFTQLVCIENSYTDDLLEIILSRNIDDERRTQEEIVQKERRSKQLLEDALQKAEKANQAKSDFLSRMSHDIRTPMNAIMGMTELALLHIGEKEKIKDYLEKIQSSSSHLLALINEVLDVSKIESGTIELAESEFDLYILIKEVVEMVRISVEKKAQMLTIDIDDELHSRVSGDMRRLKQVLVNILENASKYTDEGGKIFFTVEELKKKEPHVGTYRFVIEDTGIGMKAEYLEHIFEPFSRADDSQNNIVPGTGLGMTIVKNLISMMGGDIRVESEYKKGSRFLITICLTRCDSFKPVMAREQFQIEENFSDLRVLLVEDNELNCQIAAEMLELLDTRVEIVENGQRAVEAVCSHPPFYYDIVFMDIQMPVLNGYDATKKIRHSGMERVEELPIIAMTADAFAEDIKQARLAGMNGHLAKPISIHQLRNSLSNCLIWKQQHGRNNRKENGEKDST